MTYENLRTEGTLTEIVEDTAIDRATEPRLHFPEHLPRSRVTIQSGKNRRNLELWAVLSPSYIGKEAVLSESYFDGTHYRVFLQELYVDGEQVVNQVVVKKV